MTETLLAAAFYTYGSGPGDVVTDNSGTVQAGIDLTVWTNPNGVQITALVDLDGNQLPGFVTTTNVGRYQFRINSNTYPTVWMRTPEGSFWQVTADQLFEQIPDAIADSAEAIEIATNLQTTIGQILVTPEQFGAAGNGNTSDSTAMQAAFDALADRGGGILYLSAGRAYVINQAIKLYHRHSNITVTGPGVITRSAISTAVAIAALSGGNTGYGSGPVDVRWQGVHFKGDFAADIQFNFQFNHASRWLFDHCVFEQCQIAGHVFDSAGSDDIWWRSCTFLGRKLPDSGYISQELIQMDASVTGATSFGDDPGSYDGLFSRRFTITDCRFLPLTVDGVSYPASGCILGGHALIEDHYYDDVTIRNCYVENPNPDDISAEGTRARGVVHFNDVRRLVIDGLTVRTTEPANLCIIQIVNGTEGRFADTDFNTPAGDGDTGVWDVPNQSRTIKINNLVIDGYSQPDGSTFPKAAVYIAGVADGPVHDVVIDSATITNGYQAMKIINADWVRIVGNLDDGSTLPPDLDSTSVTRLSLSGNSWATGA